MGECKDLKKSGSHRICLRTYHSVVYFIAKSMHLLLCSPVSGRRSAIFPGVHLILAEAMSSFELKIATVGSWGMQRLQPSRCIFSIITLSRTSEMNGLQRLFAGQGFDCPMVRLLGHDGRRCWNLSIKFELPETSRYCFSHNSSISRSSFWPPCF